MKYFSYGQKRDNPVTLVALQILYDFAHKQLRCLLLTKLDEIGENSDKRMEDVLVERTIVKNSLYQNLNMKQTWKNYLEALKMCNIILFI